MEGVGSEVSAKIRSAIKAKLVELGTYVDEELPDYIMVLVANKKTKDQMDDDLSLFLGHNTERFTSWLHHVLQKLNAAALVTAPQPEEPKRKETEEETRKEEEEKEKLEERKREKAEEVKKSRDEDRRKKEKEKDRKEKKDKKLKRSHSPVSYDKPTKDKKDVLDPGKATRSKEGSKKERKKITFSEEDVSEKKKQPELSVKKMRQLLSGKVSSADIFREEASGSGTQKDEDEEGGEDTLVLKAEEEFGLDLDDEPAPKKAKVERVKNASPSSAESKLESRLESRTELKSKSKSKGESSSPARISAKDRLGTLVTPATEQPKEKPSVLDRLGSATSGKRTINLREESSFPSRSESLTGSGNAGMARAISSAISSAHRSVCVLPSSSTSSGKKLEARVRPLMSRHVESVREGSTRESSTRESTSRAASSRVVSAVGAVLKRAHPQEESDEEYDPKKPLLSSMASKVEVIPRPKRTGAIQANTALILRAMADAHKSVNKPSRRSTADKPEPSPKKQKGELFTRSYREREARQQDLPEKEEVRIRKIAITVPNATRKESEEQLRDDEKEIDSLASTPTLSPMEATEKDDIIGRLTPDMDYAPVLSDNRYAPLEEVEEEEVEEEVIDERIGDTPVVPSQILSQVPAVAGDESTKFIVTLEGVDNEVYPVIPVERPDIRSRLGIRTDTSEPMEEVEEYIEEVEEWEEEEPAGEIPTGADIGATAGTPVKARLKSAITAPPESGVPSEGNGKIEERCKFWPACKAGDSCPYHHPSFPCKAFPNCKFGDKCLYIHPNCLYDGACTRVGCPYTHASTRSFNQTTALTSLKHKAAAPSRPTVKVKCKYFPKCTNMSCPFLHPKACYYGMSCKQPSCPFTHPQVATGAKLKWIAPKASTTNATATTTTTTTTAKTSKSLAIEPVNNKQEIQSK